jgi:hypothetical protein
MHLCDEVLPLAILNPALTGRFPSERLQECLRYKSPAIKRRGSVGRPSPAGGVGNITDTAPSLAVLRCRMTVRRFCQKAVPVQAVSGNLTTRRPTENICKTRARLSFQGRLDKDEQAHTLIPR